uniref:phospholipase D n=1 Tax=Globisporangium ultimum (strain ATCC 200006 / CBS 805.95 / DAOM BR144) TaxID=431595 RepID=K3WNR2_GLOUD
MSLSDGSEVEVEQPITDPEQWFLTQDEITASRGGVVRDDLSDYTSGNQVEAYVATKEYFDRIYEDLEATRKNDLILLSAWSTDDVPFKPETDPVNSTFHGVISRAVARGAHFHALVWNNLIEHEQNVKMRDFINALPVSPNGGTAQFIFDDRLSAAQSAHHQKTVAIIRDSEVVVAYAGGIDLTGDRWDRITHDQASFREKSGIKPTSNGWLDAQVRINGSAADDIAVNFLARWNSKTRPAQDLLDDVLDFENPAFSVLPLLAVPDSFDDVSDLTESEEDILGTHNVQIVRTFSCAYQNYEFAPKGENSILQARIKAIRNAKNYIYIEDQYFLLVPELLNELLNVLPHLQRVIAVVQRPVSEAKLAGFEKFMFDMVSPMQKLFPNKFQLYTTKESRDLYIHTKLVIVDDVYLSISSANWNRRSMTSDSEIGVNVVDDTTVENPDGVMVSQLALDYRLRKFTELTGETYDTLAKLKFFDAANQLDVAAKSFETIIEPLELDEKAYFAAYRSDQVHSLVDPLDVC